MQPGVRLFCTAGVHPHDARTCDGCTLEALRALARNSECVAIGECGLDYDRMFSRREVQLEWFERQARLAAELDMPLFVHERDLEADKGAPLGSAADLIRILGSAGVRPERVCVHCFTGCHEVLSHCSAGRTNLAMCRRSPAPSLSYTICRWSRWRSRRLRTRANSSD